MSVTPEPNPQSPEGRLRPTEDIPAAEYGSTQQFKAFVNSDDEDLAEPRSDEQVPDVVLPEDSAPTSAQVLAASDGMPAQVPPSDLPVRDSGPRSIYLALAVLAVVAIAVVVLLLLI